MEVLYDTADNIVNTVLGHNMAATWYRVIKQFMVLYISKYTLCRFYMHNQNWNTELEELCILLL